MLKRYRYKLTGPYNETELNDIHRVSSFLYMKFASGDKNLSDLEKDYIKYSRSVFWHYTKYPAFLSGLTFLVSDMVYPINRLHFFPRLFIKLFSSYSVLKMGIDTAAVKILEFPLLDEVVSEGIIKYTEWVDLSSPD